MHPLESHLVYESRLGTRSGQCACLYSSPSRSNKLFKALVDSSVTVQNDKGGGGSGFTLTLYRVNFLARSAECLCACSMCDAECCRPRQPRFLQLPRQVFCHSLSALPLVVAGAIAVQFSYFTMVLTTSAALLGWPLVVV